MEEYGFIGSFENVSLRLQLFNSGFQKFNKQKIQPWNYQIRSIVIQYLLARSTGNLAEDQL